MTCLGRYLPRSILCSPLEVSGCNTFETALRIRITWTCSIGGGNGFDFTSLVSSNTALETLSQTLGVSGPKGSLNFILLIHKELANGGTYGKVPREMYSTALFHLQSSVTFQAPATSHPCLRMGANFTLRCYSCTRRTERYTDILPRKKRLRQREISFTSAAQGSNSYMMHDPEPHILPLLPSWNGLTVSGYTISTALDGCPRCKRGLLEEPRSPPTESWDVISHSLPNEEPGFDDFQRKTHSYVSSSTLCSVLGGTQRTLRRLVNGYLFLKSAPGKSM